MLCRYQRSRTVETVLLVENEPDVLAVATELFASIGYEVTLAALAFISNPRFIAARRSDLCAAKVILSMAPAHRLPRFSLRLASTLFVPRGSLCAVQGPSGSRFQCESGRDTRQG